MADISIQFHALPEELLPFVKGFVEEFKLHVAAMSFPPFAAVELDASELDKAFDPASPYDQLAFTLNAPVLPVKGALEFSDKNPGSLHLHIGAQEEKGLKESWLSARTEDAEAIAVWKEIARRLKSLTEKGAIAVNPKTGGSGPAPTHRYTAGAKALEASGVPMLTITDIVLKPAAFKAPKSQKGG